MNLDNRLLIKQVEARPALWNRYHGDYCHKITVSKLWAEIAAFHGVHESRVRNKWRALRDTFRQELKKSSQPTPWTFYQDMSFLRGHMKTMRARSPVKPGDGKTEAEEENAAGIKAEPEEIRSVFLGDCTEDGSLGFASADADGEGKTLTGRPPEEEDDDYHFLMSFLPEMRRLDPKKKMSLRIKMLELFYREIYQRNFL